MENGRQRMTCLKKKKSDLGRTDKQQRNAATKLALELIEEFHTRIHDPTTVDDGLTLETLAVLYEARGFFGRHARLKALEGA